MEVRQQQHQQQQQQQHPYEHQYHQHRQVKRPLLVSSSTRSTPPSSPSGGGGVDSDELQKCTSNSEGDTWILSHGSWTKKDPETRYSMTGSPIRSRDESSSSPAAMLHSHSQKTKKKKRGSSSSSSSSSLQKTLSSRTVKEQREVATLLRADSTASDASHGEETSDNGISESSFSERLEYMSRLAERNRQQMRSQPPSPTRSSNNSRRRSSPNKLTPNTRDGAAAAGRTSSSSSSSPPPRALYLRNRKNSRKDGSGSNSSSHNTTSSTTNGSPPPPEPSRPAYLTSIQKHSSLVGRDKSPNKKPSTSGTTTSTMTAKATNHHRFSRSKGGDGTGRFNLNRSTSFSGRPTSPPQSLLLRPPSSMSDEGGTATIVPKKSSSYINDAVEKMNNTLQQNGTIILAPVMQRSQSAAAATAASANKPQDLSRDSEEVPLVVESSVASLTSSLDSRSHHGSTASSTSSVLPTPKVHAIRAAFGQDCDIYNDVLCVSRAATDGQIRIAYFRRGRQVLAETTTTSTKQESEKEKKTKNGSAAVATTVMADLPVSAKEKFQAVSLAYEILCKPACKKEYDAHGWKLVAPLNKTTDDASTAKPDCQVMTSTTITDIPGIKITSTTSTAKETPSPSPPPPPSTGTHHVDDHYTASAPSEVVSVDAASGEQSSSILRPTSHSPAPPSAASSVSDTGNGNNNGNNGNDAPRSTSRTRIRWSEEVEELVYRQDPDERRFKVRGSAQYHDSDSESGESAEDETNSSTTSCSSRDPTEDSLRDEDGVADSAGNANHHQSRRHHLQYISQEIERTTFDEDDNSMIEEPGSRPQQMIPSKPPKKKKIVVDRDSIHRKLSNLEKKTFENTFVASFLNDIDRSLDGLEDSFDGMFGGKTLADYDEHDEVDNKDVRNNDTSAKPVEKQKKPGTIPTQTPVVSSEQLSSAQGFHSSPNTVIQDANDNNDAAVQDLFSELTKPARVLFHDEALPLPDSIPASKDSKTPMDDAKAIDTSMGETDRAFSPVLHEENTNGTFGGLVNVKSEDFEDVFDPFNDSFQSEVPGEEEGGDDETEKQAAFPDPALAPAQAMTKVGSGVGEYSCSTPSSLTLNREPGVDPFLSQPFALRRGSTCKRRPMHPSSPPPPSGTPPQTSATATETTFHMSTPSAASPIRGDTIFPRTHSGMSSLTGPASCVTSDTEVMLKQAEGNLCAMINKEDAQSVLDKKATEKPAGSDTNQDFFAHVMSYMDALSQDIQKFSQAPCQVPCQVVDETTQIFFDAVVIPEENLDSMLAAFKVDAPTACTTTPSVERAYTL